MDMPKGSTSRKEYAKRYWQENKEKLREQKRKYYLDHKEEHILRCKRYEKNHKEELTAYRKNYYRNNKKRINDLNRKIRMQVLSHYGGNPPNCSCCGESYFEFLALDHISGGGLKEKRDLRRSGGTSLYRSIIKRKFPSGYQVLCHNCNMAKGLYGECPHQRHRSEKLRK